MPATATVAVGLAALFDRLVGEPPSNVHPVALFGRVVAPADRAWSHPSLAGVVVAIALPLFASGSAFAFVSILSPVPALASLVAGLVIFSTTSLRMLSDEARRVVALSTDDVPAARDALLSLAGRDASSLTAPELRSAAVESLAENLADGFVAPLLAFALVAPVSLAGGAAAATWVKAVNTLDSMLGYPHKPHGTASARLDDLTMWLPARLTAVLIALTALDFRALSRAHEQSSNPPSPNSGWPMATLAATLSLRLEKPGVYVLDFGTLPSAADAERARTLVTRTGWLSVVIAGVVVWF